MGRTELRSLPQRGSQATQHKSTVLTPPSSDRKEEGESDPGSERQNPELRDSCLPSTTNNGPVKPQAIRKSQPPVPQGPAHPQGSGGAPTFRDLPTCFNFS